MIFPGACSRSVTYFCLTIALVLVTLPMNGAQICIQGAIRLRSITEGFDFTRGRVEICNNNVWGTVCISGWGSRPVNAAVACRQLGFSIINAINWLSGIANGVGEIWLDDVQCNGNETRLIDCPARPLGSHNCDHTDDIGVRCMHQGISSTTTTSSTTTPTTSSPRTTNKAISSATATSSTTATTTIAATPTTSSPRTTNKAISSATATSSTTATTTIAATPTTSSPRTTNKAISSATATSSTTATTTIAATSTTSSPRTYVSVTTGGITTTTTLSNTSISNTTTVVGGTVAAIGGAVGGAVFLVLFTVTIVILVLVRRKTHKSRDLRPKTKFMVKETTPRYYSEKGEETEYSKWIKKMSMKSSFRQKIPKALLVQSCNLQIGKTIGQGEYGIVYKGLVRDSSNQHFSEAVAVKTLKGFATKESVKDLLRECAKMMTLDHPNVLKLRGVCLDGGPSPYIIMPFLSNGSLHPYLKENRESLVDDPIYCTSTSQMDNLDLRKKLIGMCFQVAKGMEYLASKKVIHRDLAARNCMIDMNFVIKVSDFGLSESLDSDKAYFRQDEGTTTKFPFKWLAPESISKSIFTEKTDVWSYGVTCWEIFSGGDTPYPDIHPLEVSHYLKKGDRMEKPQNFACTDGIYQIMKSCWDANADKRPHFSELVVKISALLGSMSGYFDLGSTPITSESNVLLCGDAEDAHEDTLYY